MGSCSDPKPFLGGKTLMLRWQTHSIQNKFIDTNNTFTFFSFGTMCCICVHAMNQSQYKNIICSKFPSDRTNRLLIQLLIFGLVGLVFLTHFFSQVYKSKFHNLYNLIRFDHTFLVCVHDVPKTHNYVGVTDTEGSHNVIRQPTSKPTNGTSKLDTW
jgi:hypothetical protein